MALSLGTVVGQIRIDISQASAAYAALRAQHVQTLGALNGSAEGFRKSGLVMAATGGVMVAAFGKAVQSAAEFEKRLDFFGAVSNSTAKQMDAVRDKAIQLGQDTKYSANEIADSFVELGKAGVSATDIVNGVGAAVANLGASADIPLAQSANIITSQLQAFGLGAGQAVHVANELQGAANASIAEVQDLGVSLKYVGGVAAAVHIPFESTVDAISLLAKAGIKGSTAGTSLRQMIVSLQGNSKKATEELKSLGIVTADGTNKFIDAQGHIKPLSEVFQILQDHTKGLTEAQRLMAFKVIFNNRALAAAAILTQAGAKGFKDMHAAIGNTTAEDVAHKRMDNLAGDIEILRGNIETLLIKGGTPFQNFLRAIVQGITKVLQIFTSLPQGVQVAIIGFIGIVGAGLLLMGMFNLMVGTILSFGATLVKLGEAFSFVSKILPVVTTAMEALDLAFLANPVFLIIAAIVALVAIFVILYMKSETVRNAVAAVGSALLVAWNAVVNFFKGMPAFFSSVWSSITGAFQGALNWISSNWPLIVAIITGPLGLAVYAVIHFKDQIIGFFQNLWNTAKSATVNGVSAVLGFFSTLPERIAYWVGFAIGRTVRLWLDLWNSLIRLTVQGINSVANFFVALPGRIASFFTLVYTRAVALWGQLWSWLKTATANGVSAVINFFATLPGRVASFFSAMYSRAISLMTSLWNGARSRAAAIVSGIISFIQQLPGRVGSFFSSMYQRVVSALGSLVNAARSGASRIVSGIIGGITALPGLIGGVFSRALGALGNFASAAFNKARDIGGALWNGFKDGLGIHSPSYIEKAMFAIRDNMGVETDNIANKVKAIQGLGNSLVNNNPLTAMAGGLSVPVGPATATATRAIAGPSIAASVPSQRRGVAPAGAQGSAGKASTFNVTINNPAPEPSSDSLYRTQQKLIYLGLDGDS